MENLSSFQELIARLNESFTCFICLEVITDPYVLSCCGQIVCKKCILPWIEEHTTCPFCRHDITSSQIVPIKWANNFKKILLLLRESSSSNELCQMHNKPKEFFCKVCNSYLCGDCLFEEFRSQTPKHKSHQIITITEKFTETKKAIKEKLHLFNPKIEDIKSVCYEILKNIGILTKSKDEISIDMYSQFATLEKRIDDAFFKYDKSLNDQIKQLQLIQNEIDSILQRLQLYLLDDSLVDFSSISTSLESAEKVETLLSTLEIPHSFPSIDNELLPQYSSVKICIPDFIETVERFRQLDDTSIRFFYSDKIKIGGNLWRAKIYPNGNGNGVNTHLSVFVELLDGYTEPSTYYYKMEIFGCKNDVPPLVRQYASTFVKMDSWGWNKAAALSKIINGDYIGEDGGLCIQLSIKPESYFQENRDLHHALEKKRKKLEKLKKLKEMCEHKE